MEETTLTEKNRSVSPPLEQTPDYRSIGVVADSTSGIGGNSEPSYRQVTTTTGYVNGGQSINFRPRQAEPPENGLGVGEIDFDSKVTEEYANLDEVRDRHYHLASAASHSPDRLYRGVVNTGIVKKEKSTACSTCVLSCITIMVLVISICALGLSIFNVLNTFETGKYSSSRPQLPPNNSVSEVSLQLRQDLDKIRIQLNSSNSSNSTTNLTAIHIELELLKEQIQYLYNQTAVSPTQGFGNISLYNNCDTSPEGSCMLTSNFVDGSSSPPFSRCTTQPRSLRQDGKYLANVFCIIKEANPVMPVMTSLSFKDEKWSCACHGLEIPTSFNREWVNLECEMRATRCPVNTRIPYS